MYEKMETKPIGVNDGCCEPKLGICEKAKEIHELTKLIMNQAYAIKGTLIGNTEGEADRADIPIGCLENEIDGIDAKLRRIHYVLESIALNL